MKKQIFRKAVVLMISLQSYVRKGHRLLRRWALDPRAHVALKVGAHLLGGFCMSAASLAGRPLPLSAGLLCFSSGWNAVLAALGGSGGYLAFWGKNGQEMLLCLWSVLGANLLLRRIPLTKEAPLLLPSVCAMTAAVWGLVFHSGAQNVAAFVHYLLRIAASFASSWLFYRLSEKPDPILQWLGCGLGVFALAQILPIPYLGLGFLAAGFLLAAASFPASTISGLALDLAQVTPVPMTAVLTLGYLVRFLPWQNKLLLRLAPAVVYVAVMRLGGQMDLMPLPGLFLGSVLGTLIPPRSRTQHRRGETGAAQVRLEVAAEVLSQTRQLLLEAVPTPVDKDALVHRAAERACSGCPYRKACRDCRRLAALPGSLLEKPLRYAQELPIVCRKSGRFLTELHRSREQLGAILADRQRQAEYRTALQQQYQFLSDFLQELSDNLTRRTPKGEPVYAPWVGVYGNRPEADNGDQCIRFLGAEGKYYVLLCDGMGTGSGAVQESRQAGMLLRRMLSAGFPADHALRSFNSLCALRERAAAVTVDLAQIDLDTGKTVLYKWGAAPSYLISRGGAERIGQVVPPPGLWVDRPQESVHALTLRREQILVLASDGVEDAAALRCCTESVGSSISDLATGLLACVRPDQNDDATVVLVQLQVEKN